MKRILKINPAKFPINLSLTDKMFEHWCVNKLKDAGIPVKTEKFWYVTKWKDDEIVMKKISVFCGVEKGILEMHKDVHDLNLIFEWTC